MKRSFTIFIFNAFLCTFAARAMQMPAVKQINRFVATQADGKTLILEQGDKPYFWQVLRFNTDGKPDTSFGYGMGKIGYGGDEEKSVVTPLGLVRNPDGYTTVVFSEKKDGQEQILQMTFNYQGRFKLVKEGGIIAPYKF